MGKAGNGQAGGIVLWHLNISMAQGRIGHNLIPRIIHTYTATRLQTNEAVLDNINTTDTVVMADLVENVHDLNRTGDGTLTLNINLDRDTFLKVNGKPLGLVGGIQWVNGWNIVLE